jgi:hypothetical protein
MPTCCVLLLQRLFVWHTQNTKQLIKQIPQGQQLEKGIINRPFIQKENISTDNQLEQPQGTLD